MSLDLVLTLCALVASAGLFWFASHRASRPPDPLRPRLAPWRSLIVLAGVVGVFLLVHLINLAGIRTGPPGY